MRSIIEEEMKNPLIEAVKKGVSGDELEELAKTNNVHFKLINGESPLSIAAANGHLETVNKLLNLGACPDEKAIRNATNYPKIKSILKKAQNSINPYTTINTSNNCFTTQDDAEIDDGTPFNLSGVKINVITECVNGLVSILKQSDDDDKTLKSVKFTKETVDPRNRFYVPRRTHRSYENFKKLFFFENFLEGQSIGDKEQSKLIQENITKLNINLQQYYFFDLITSKDYKNISKNIGLRNEKLTNEEKETIKKKIDETTDLKKIKSFFEKYYPFIKEDDSDSSDLETDSDSEDEAPIPPEDQPPLPEDGPPILPEK